MLEIETIDLYHLRLYGLYLEVNLFLLPTSQGWKEEKKPFDSHIAAAYLTH